jgi:signal transduction histidine kinase/ActR/RegA family two-component response regulator
MDSRPAAPPAPASRPLPRWSFLLAVVVTLATLGTLAQGVRHAQHIVQGFEGTQIATENVCGRITWLDEVLTMSARMAAATGDPAWQARYERCVPQLDLAIAEAHCLAPGEVEDQAARQTDQANRALVALELEAFERVTAGDLSGASALLASPAYESAKAVYAQGMERFLASMRARTSALLAVERERAARVNLVLAVAVPLLVLLWALIGRALRANRHALREHAAALERGRRELEAAMRAKSDFLARMSHEIRTPMNGVLGLSELLAETELDAEQRELLRTVQSSGALLLAIIDDILDLSKIEAGMLRIAPVPTDVRRLAREGLAILAPRAQGKGLTLACTVADGVPACVSIDPTRLRQVLTNLLGNAIKFTERGRVAVALAWSHGELSLEVRDTGVGIAPEALESIFESFVQADDSIGRRFGGTGLGLTISRELVRGMGGEITVESEPGAGTCFRVRVPAPELEDQSGAAALSDPAHAARWDARVLVVEDNPVNLVVARRLIERTGCSVTCAANGAECLERLREARFDLVFMDCGMPVLDGFETTRRIRASESGARHLPIVALSASAFPGDVEACRAAGMDDFVAKPFGQAQLEGVLLRWVGPPAPARALPAARVRADAQVEA